MCVTVCVCVCMRACVCVHECVCVCLFILPVIMLLFFTLQTLRLQDHLCYICFLVSEHSIVDAECGSLDSYHIKLTVWQSIYNTKPIMWQSIQYQMYGSLFVILYETNSMAVYSYHYQVHIVSLFMPNQQYGSLFISLSSPHCQSIHAKPTVWQSIHIIIKSTLSVYSCQTNSMAVYSYHYQVHIVSLFMPNQQYGSLFISLSSPHCQSIHAKPTVWQSIHIIIKSTLSVYSCQTNSVAASLFRSDQQCGSQSSHTKTTAWQSVYS